MSEFQGSTSHTTNQSSPPSRIPIPSTRLAGSNDRNESNSSSASEDEGSSSKLSDLQLNEWQQPSSSQSWQSAMRTARRNSFYQAQIEAVHQRNENLERRIKQLENRPGHLADRIDLVEKWYTALQKCYLRTNKQIRGIHPSAVERIAGLKHYCQLQGNLLADLVVRADVKRIIYADEECLKKLHTWKEWRGSNVAFLEYEFDPDKEVLRKEKAEEWRQVWKREKRIFKAGVKELVDEPPDDDEVL